MTTFEEFKSAVKHGNVIPVFDTILADTDTPVSVYLKIKDESPYSFLLESIEGGEKLARYSFLGFDPFMTFEIHGKSFAIKSLHDDVIVLPSLANPGDDPLKALRTIFGHFKTVKTEGLPRLSGGAVGFFGYETVQLVEDIPIVSKDEMCIPDGLLIFCDTMLIFDNVLNRMFLVSNGYVPTSDMAESILRKEYDKAVAEIARLKRILKKNIQPDPTTPHANGVLKYEITKGEFISGVQKAKNYIVEGDIFQVVLSQRLTRNAELPSFDLYRMLRVINPSPYMYYLQLDGFSIIGSSPEMLVRVENGIVETRPIAGTRRRGNSPEEDLRLGHELLHDEKERAEHLMLVDLGRNDIGRISDAGSVQLTEFMSVERYSHVMHIVSNIRGTLKKELSPVDALFSCFPAGTLTGAPKIRAMEIIAELEPVKRNVYGGAVGYIDFTGNLDSCIAIRTIVEKDGVLYFQAGAGIVFDSVPEREYEETLEKLGANLKALDMLVGVQ